MEEFVHACAEGDIERIKAILLEEPCLIREVTTSHQRTGLMEACEHGRPEVVALLLQHTEGSCADVDASDVDGETPLLCACANGNADCVLQLLMAGASCNATNHLGDTPAITAARTAHPRALHHLIHTGKADVAAADPTHGMPPLSWAANAGYVGVVDVLLKGGAQHSPTDRYV
jgi:ankyrin repeat protein